MEETPVALRGTETDSSRNVKTKRYFLTLLPLSLGSALPLSMRGHWLPRWFGAVLFGITLLVCAGCQTLAPSQQQQLQAAEEMNHDVNPELAEAAGVVGPLLYYFLECFQHFH